ncbi:bifunctional adenosylcobinamide kinase/adenosylcobinamide-phosphate guanylyltransferase [Thalassotalea sp. PLHSN55]|uniref:bifunctional adenosylcobinamide kinase/adenosylcobinamide-phosphate guanylyltransferase n=1 Tax=Thalassotalea sp. PLHSN55 TaxID=3435888 RepID=UPI003F86D6D0
MNNIHLVLGGARSGKSRFAEQIARQSQQSGAEQVTYIATAERGDDEMQQRIDMHQAQRSQDELAKSWQLVESPLALAFSIEQAFNDSDCVLVDCLTLWLSNCLCKGALDLWQQEKAALLQLLERLSHSTEKTLILVSNEVGHGIVPLGDLARDFVDQAGWLHQDIGKIASHVDFIMAGLPLTLKNDANTEMNP